MPVFRLQSRDGRHEVVVRHRCVSCVREFVATRSPADQMDLWASRQLSDLTCRQADQVEYPATGPAAILSRRDDGR